jgi:hypothetical protein
MKSALAASNLLPKLTKLCCMEAQDHSKSNTLGAPLESFPPGVARWQPETRIAASIGGSANKYAEKVKGLKSRSDMTGSPRITWQKSSKNVPDRAAEYYAITV